MNFKTMRLAVSFLTLALPVFAAAPAMAIEGTKVPAEKHTKPGLYLSAKEAYELVKNNPGKALLVDVRTPAELAFLGTATVTGAHVPYEMIDTSKWDSKKNEYQMVINKNFVAEVTARLNQKKLGKDDVIILMCRSGSRSAGGVNLLAAAGYTKVYNQVEGYEGDKAGDGPNKGQRTVNGWKNAGLPWTYKLSADVVYLTK